LLPTKVFIRVDLPELGIPNILTKPDLVFGFLVNMVNHNYLH
jgi:hypothetical protein